MKRMRVLIFIFVIIGYSINILPLNSSVPENSLPTTGIVIGERQSDTELKGASFEKSDKKFLFPFIILGVWLLAGGMVNSRVRNYESNNS